MKKWINGSFYDMTDEEIGAMTRELARQKQEQQPTMEERMDMMEETIKLVVSQLMAFGSKLFPGTGETPGA